jgi:hypothetical protein
LKEFVTNDRLVRSLVIRRGIIRIENQLMLMSLIDSGPHRIASPGLIWFRDVSVGSRRHGQTFRLDRAGLCCQKPMTPLELIGEFASKTTPQA